MTSEIYKLKHFHVENYSGTNFTDDKGWMPKETIYIDCVEVEISPDNWIMSVDADNTDLLILSCNLVFNGKNVLV